MLQALRHNFPNAVKMLANFFQQMVVTDPYIDVMYKDFHNVHTDDFWATTSRTINPLLTSSKPKRNRTKRTKNTVDEFWTTTEMNIFEHPLVDKKYISMDKFSTKETTTNLGDSAALTTHDPMIDPAFISELERIQEVVKDALGENIRTGRDQDYVTEKHIRVMPIDPRYDDDISTSNNASDNYEDDVSDNYEDESTNLISEENGLSIENDFTTQLERAGLKVTAQYINPTSKFSSNVYDSQKFIKKQPLQEENTEYNNVITSFLNKSKTTRKLLNRFRQVKNDNQNDGRPQDKTNNVFFKPSISDRLRTTNHHHIEYEDDRNSWKTRQPPYNNDFFRKISDVSRKEYSKLKYQTTPFQITDSIGHKEQYTSTDMSPAFKEFYKYHDIRHHDDDIDSEIYNEKNNFKKIHDNSIIRSENIMVTGKRVTENSEKPTNNFDEEVRSEKKIGRTMAISDDSNDYNSDYRNSEGNRESRRSILEYINID